MAMNELVPFRFKEMQTTEALWGHAAENPLGRFRMTRKGWGEFFGAKNPQTYMDELKHRHPRLPLGIPSTVEGMLGQQYLVYTLDVWEGHQYAVESTLPRAREFLRRFPAFLAALHNNRVAPVDPVLRPIILLPKWSRERAEAIKRLREESGLSYTAVNRQLNRAASGEPLNRNYPGFRRYVHKRYRDVKPEALALRAEGRPAKEISSALGVPEKTLYRWFKSTCPGA